MKAKFPRTAKHCEQCGRSFDTSFQNRDKTRFCSLSCASLSNVEAGKIGLSGPLSPSYGRPSKFSLYGPAIDRTGRKTTFRSSYEIAFVRDYLDKNALSWEYEPRTFDLIGTTYTPDFYVNELGSFVEVKGWMRPEAQAKIERFRKLFPDERLIVADHDALVEKFGVDLSKKAISSIIAEHRIKTYVRMRDRERTNVR